MKTPTRFWNRHIILLWQGQFVSNLGNQAFLIAIIFWIKEATGSATLMGLILMLSSLPGIILGPFGGTLADRYSRRNIIVICDLLGGLTVLILAGLMFLMPDATNLILAWLVVTAMLLAMINAFFEPAIAAAVPDLVPKDRIAGANSVSQTVIGMATLIGQAVGGLLYRILGAPLLMLFNGLSFLFSALSELFISIPQHIPEKSATIREQLADFRRDLVGGLRYVWGARGLRGLVFLSALGNFFNVPIIILLPFFVEDVLRLTPDWYGYLLAIYSAGNLVGYMFAGALNLSGRSRATVAVLFMVLEPLGYALFTIIQVPALLLLIAGLAGITSGFLIIAVTTVVQLSTPGEMRGRVFGLLGTISATLAPIATGLAGVIADLIGQRITPIYLVCSLMMLLVALPIGLTPSIRAFLAYEAEDADQASEQVASAAPALPPAGERAGG